MDTIQDQIRELQVTVKKLRERLDALQRGDATFDKITCKEWQLVDKDGKTRIGAGTRADSNADAGVVWRDKDGKFRIIAGTKADGEAGVWWYDKNEKRRISAATSGGGTAAVVWCDKDRNPRIVAGVNPDGTVTYPTKNGK